MEHCQKCRLARIFRIYMSLTRQDVEKIANLARLAISEQELPVYVSSLSSIVAFVDELSRVDTGTVQPMSHPLDGPLNGLRVAIDPGHIGGPWAQMEGRSTRYNGSAPSDDRALLRDIAHTPAGETITPGSNHGAP